MPGRVVGVAFGQGAVAAEAHSGRFKQGAGSHSVVWVEGGICRRGGSPQLEAFLICVGIGDDGHRDCLAGLARQEHQVASRTCDGDVVSARLGGAIYRPVGGSDGLFGNDGGEAMVGRQFDDKLQGALALVARYIGHRQHRQAGQVVDDHCISALARSDAMGGRYVREGHGDTAVVLVSVVIVCYGHRHYCGARVGGYGHSKAAGLAFCQIAAHLGDGYRHLYSGAHSLRDSNGEGYGAAYGAAFSSLLVWVIGGDGQLRQVIVPDGGGSRCMGDGGGLHGGARYLPLGVGQLQREGSVHARVLVILGQGNPYPGAGLACRHGQGAGNMGVVAWRHGSAGHSGVIQRQGGAGWPCQADDKLNRAVRLLHGDIGNGQAGQPFVIKDAGLGGNPGGVAGAAEVHHLGIFTAGHQLQGEVFRWLADAVIGYGQAEAVAGVARLEHKGVHHHLEVAGHARLVKGGARRQQRPGCVPHRDCLARGGIQRHSDGGGGAFHELKPRRGVGGKAGNGQGADVGHRNGGSAGTWRNAVAAGYGSKSGGDAAVLFIQAVGVCAHR